MEKSDKAKIYVKAGDGGKNGDGGNIVFVASGDRETLSDFHYQQYYEAESGKRGIGQKGLGTGGEDLLIKVPVGTKIFAADGETLLAELTQEGVSYIVAQGGRGGLEDQTSQYALGEEAWLVLKLSEDVDEDDEDSYMIRQRPVAFNPNKKKRRKKKKLKPTDSDTDPDDDDDDDDGEDGSGGSDDGEEDENELVFTEEKQKAAMPPNMFFDPKILARRASKPKQEPSQDPEKMPRSPFQQFFDAILHGAKEAEIKNGDQPSKPSFFDRLMVGLGFKSFKEDLLLSERARKYWKQKLKGYGPDESLINTDLVKKQVKREILADRVPYVDPKAVTDKGALEQAQRVRTERRMEHERDIQQTILEKKRLQERHLQEEQTEKGRKAADSKRVVNNELVQTKQDDSLGKTPVRETQEIKTSAGKMKENGEKSVQMQTLEAVEKKRENIAIQDTLALQKTDNIMMQMQAQAMQRGQAKAAELAADKLMAGLQQQELMSIRQIGSRVRSGLAAVKGQPQEPRGPEGPRHSHQHPHRPRPEMGDMQDGSRRFGREFISRTVGGGHSEGKYPSADGRPGVPQPGHSDHQGMGSLQGQQKVPDQPREEQKPTQPTKGQATH